MFTESKALFTQEEKEIPKELNLKDNNSLKINHPELKITRQHNREFSINSQLPFWPGLFTKNWFGSLQNLNIEIEGNTSKKSKWAIKYLEFGTSANSIDGEFTKVEADFIYSTDNKPVTDPENQIYLSKIELSIKKGNWNISPQTKKVPIDPTKDITEEQKMKKNKEEVALEKILQEIDNFKLVKPEKK